jgi:hypothetical protein
VWVLSTRVSVVSVIMSAISRSGNVCAIGKRVGLMTRVDGSEKEPITVRGFVGGPGAVAWGGQPPRCM